MQNNKGNGGEIDEKETGENVYGEKKEDLKNICNQIQSIHQVIKSLKT